MRSPRPRNGTESALHDILNALALPHFDTEAPEETGGKRGVLSPCVLCRLTEASVARTLRAWFAEFVNDPPSRERLRRSRGFCRDHSRVLGEVGDALGVAILYADLADQAQMRWQAEAGNGARRFALPSRTTRPEPCPACVEERAAEQRYAGALADGLAQPEIWTRWESDGALCVAHAEMTLARADPQTAAHLRNQQAAQLARLQAELEEIIRKHDYRFRGEAWGTERTAWRRALHRLFRPPPE